LRSRTADASDSTGWRKTCCRAFGAQDCGYRFRGGAAVPDLPTPEELRVLRGGLAAARDRKLRMWALPVDQIARLVAAAEAHVIDTEKPVCPCPPNDCQAHCMVDTRYQCRVGANSGARSAQRWLVSALRVKAGRALKSAISEAFLAWLEGEADPLAALER
jgi:hypothetical protein